MVLPKPKAGDKLNYFTSRKLENDGFARVWRFEGEDLVNIEYKCPSCKHSGEKQQVFERQKVSIKNPRTGKRKTVQAFVFKCDKCGHEIKLEKWGRGGPGKKKAA